MMRRVMVLGLILVMVSLFTAAAQDDGVPVADFIPADFAGFIRLRTDDAAVSLQRLNGLMLMATIVQPSRVPSLGGQTLGYDNFIPFPELFDALFPDESVASFSNTILPWLGDELVIAYRDIDPGLQTGVDDALLILPNSDLMTAASLISRVMGAQDRPSDETYRGVLITIGDQTAFAVTSPAVFIGSPELIKAALDVQAGETDSLTDTPAYRALAAEWDDNPLLTGYVRGDYVARAVSGLFSPDPATESYLAAFGGALAELRGEDSFEARLLNGDFDAAGATIDFDADLNNLVAHALLRRADGGLETGSGAFETGLFDLIPRHASLVYSGTDLPGLIVDGLAAMPMSNFAGQILGGLPVFTAGTTSTLVGAPTAEDVVRAVNGFLDTMEQFDEYSLRDDLLAHLAGNYALAVLPRPNNPLPVLNTRYDLLLLAEVSDDEAAVNGASGLLQSAFGYTALDEETLDGWTFATVGPEGGAVVFRVGAQDGLLIVASGDGAALALAASEGDNQMVDLPAWNALDAGSQPGLYVDVVPFYNTFFPSLGGQTPGGTTRTRVLLQGNALSDTLAELRLTITLPG